MRYFLFLVILVTLSANAQRSHLLKTDTLSSHKLYRKSVVPIGFIGLGLLANKSNFEKKFQINIRNKVGNNFENGIDNYLQYIPIVELYTADILSVKSKNHWFDQTKNLLIANAITAGITHSLKTSKKLRPSGTAHSFPSGHTSFAFTNASVLYQEFHNSSPTLAYSGYVFATTTGVFRVLNNKHWISDVLVGAGIGILVTEVVYYFEPLKSFNPFINNKNISLIPIISDENIGFYFSRRF